MLYGANAVIEDDPILGRVIAVYPSDRARLIIPAALVVGGVGVLLNFTLAQVPEWWGPLLTALISGVLALAFGWRALHLWNREIILYQNGFSYREGSRTVYFLYAEIRSIRQRAERLAYFGGLLRRTVYRYTMTAMQGEKIVLTNLYRHVDELGARIERSVNAELGPFIDERLSKGERVSFSDTLAVSADGLHEGGRDLPWAAFGGYQAKGGRLNLLQAGGEVWYSAPLAEVDNIGLLLPLLRAHEANPSPNQGVSNVTSG